MWIDFFSILLKRVRCIGSFIRSAPAELKSFHYFGIEAQDFEILRDLSIRHIIA